MKRRPVTQLSTTMKMHNMNYFKWSALALLAGTMLWGGSAGNRMLLGLLATCLAIKTAGQAFGLSAPVAGLPDNVVVAWQAHVLGASLGWLAAVIHLAKWRQHGHRIRL